MQLRTIGWYSDMFALLSDRSREALAHSCLHYNLPGCLASRWPGGRTVRQPGTQVTMQPCNHAARYPGRHQDSHSASQPALTQVHSMSIVRATMVVPASGACNSMFGKRSLCQPRCAGRQSGHGANIYYRYGISVCVCVCVCVT